MNFRKISLFFVIFLLFALVLVQMAEAGFGIAPPYVRNDKLARGSHYEQKILLVRGDPVEDLKAEIAIDVPKANDWISIDKGKEFILPKDEKKVPMVVSVNVPQNAKFDNYEGAIQIRVSSLKPPESGTVSIALGGQIDVRLNVTKAEIFDFLVRLVTIPDSPEGGSLKVLLKVENTGNIKSAPSRVHLDVFDSFHRDLLWSGDDSRLEKIKPFETKEIFAEFKTKLAMGQYRGDIKIFKGEEVAREEQVFFTITEKEKGFVAFAGREIGGLSVWLWVIFGVVILAGLGFGFWFFWKKKIFCKIKAKIAKKIAKKQELPTIEEEPGTEEPRAEENNTD